MCIVRILRDGGTWFLQSFVCLQKHWSVLCIYWFNGPAYTELQLILCCTIGQYVIPSMIRKGRHNDGAWTYPIWVQKIKENNLFEIILNNLDLQILQPINISKPFLVFCFSRWTVHICFMKNFRNWCPGLKIWNTSFNAWSIFVVSLSRVWLSVETYNMSIDPWLQ